jgi:hypothetical protein
MNMNEWMIEVWMMCSSLVLVFVVVGTGAPFEE